MKAHRTLKLTHKQVGIITHALKIADNTMHEERMKLIQIFKETEQPDLTNELYSRQNEFYDLAADIKASKLDV